MTSRKPIINIHPVGYDNSLPTQIIERPIKTEEQKSSSLAYLMDNICKEAVEKVRRALGDTDLSDDCFITSLVLKQLLDKLRVDSKLVIGYLFFPGSGACTLRHTWVEVSGKVYDASPVLDDLDVEHEYVMEPPDDAKLLVGDTRWAKEIYSELEEELRKYQAGMKEEQYLRGQSLSLKRTLMFKCGLLCLQTYMDDYG